MSGVYEIYKVVGPLAYLLISMCIFCTVLANPDDANKTHVNKPIVMKSFKLVHLVS